MKKELTELFKPSLHRHPLETYFGARIVMSMPIAWLQHIHLPTVMVKKFMGLICQKLQASPRSTIVRNFDGQTVARDAWFEARRCINFSLCLYHTVEEKYFNQLWRDTCCTGLIVVCRGDVEKVWLIIFFFFLHFWFHPSLLPYIVATGSPFARRSIKTLADIEYLFLYNRNGWKQLQISSAPCLFTNSRAEVYSSNFYD